MRSNLMKFFAIVLASVLLTVAVLGGIAMVFLIEQDLYEQPSEQTFLETMTYKVAYNYALEQTALAEGMTPEETVLLDTLYVPYYISDRVLQVQTDTAEPIHTSGVYRVTHTVTELLYPIALKYGEELPDGAGLPVYSDTVPGFISGEYQTYSLLYYEAPAMTVTVTLSSTPSPEMALTGFVYTLRKMLLPLVIGSTVLGLLCLVYLCWAAGRQKGREEIVPGAFGITVSTLPVEGSGLEVLSVDKNSDAYAKGIREGDILLTANGLELTSTQVLTRLKVTRGAGDLITLTVLRGGETFDVEVALTALDDMEGYP